MKFIISLFSLLLFSQALFSAPAQIETTDLAKIINQENLVLVDMSSQPEQYQRFHIGKAVYIPYKRFKNKRGKAIKPLRLTTLLGQRGISENDYVVIYDDMGGLHAGRLFWALENIGHKEVSVLNGGLVKWILEQRPVNNKIDKWIPVKYAMPTKTTNNLSKPKDILQAIKNKEVILDVRSLAEYTGNKKQKRSGHIPTAKLWSWNEHIAFDQGFVLKDKAALQQSLVNVGVTDKDQPIHVYCKSGHRANQAYWTLKTLGYNNVRLYDASMKEWMKRRKLPITKGNQP